MHDALFSLVVIQALDQLDQDRLSFGETRGMFLDPKLNWDLLQSHGAEESFLPTTDCMRHRQVSPSKGTQDSTQAIVSDQSAQNIIKFFIVWDVSRSVPPTSYRNPSFRGASSAELLLSVSLGSG